jgi:hypothetical protein
MKTDIDPKSKIAKGKKLEKYVAQTIRDKGLDKKAIRTPGSGSGQFKGDTHTKLTILGRQAHIECKNQKLLKIQEWWRQSEKDSMGYGEPLLVFKIHQEPLESAKVVVYFDTFLDLCKKAEEPKMKDPDRETTWKLERLIQAAKAVLKDLKK